MGKFARSVRERVTLLVCAFLVTFDDDPHEDDFELDTVYISELDTTLLDSDAIVVSGDCASRMEALDFCGGLVSFKMDTSTDITVISKYV